MARENKRHSKFFKAYFIVLSIAVVLLITAVIVLVFFLRDFEHAQPKYVAEQVFDQYFTGDGSTLAELLAADGFESKENLTSYVAEKLKGDVTYREISNGMDAGRKYAVKNGDDRIFTFTLAEKSRRSTFGFVQYEFGELLPAKTYSVEVVVPQGYTLYVNGVKVGDDYVTGTAADAGEYEYVPEGVTIPSKSVYTVTGLIAEPTVTAEDENGAAAEVNFDENDKVYKVALKYDEALKAEYTDYVLKAARTYAAYMQSDAGFGAVAEYIDPASELYSLTKNTITAFVIDHNGYSFENESADEFVRYDADTFSCRVKLTHKLHKNGADDYFENLDVTFFFHRVGDKFLMFDRFNMN